jgi:8-oxo-dGTP diphosphatase
MRAEPEIPRHAVAVDCAVFGLDAAGLQVLLVQRGIAPFKDRWALPGGLVLDDESVDEAARRELREETGLRDVFLEQLYTFGEVGRDPRGRVVTVAHYALVRLADHRATAATDARAAAWFAVRKAPPLAFDHDRILEKALERLQGKVRYVPLGFELLPLKFTLSQLQNLYETILERSFDKRNFRKKILDMELLIELPEVEQGVPYRPARLYRFDRKRYQELTRSGFNFEI